MKAASTEILYRASLGREIHIVRQKHDFLHTPVTRSLFWIVVSLQITCYLILSMFPDLLSFPIKSSPGLASLYPSNITVAPQDLAL
jgi:hypothetical protein